MIHYSKEEYIRKKEEELSKIAVNFNNEIEKFSEDPRSIVEFLNFAEKFNNYSINNSIYLYIQEPNAKFVTSFSKWKELGIKINKGEKALKVFAPILKTYYKDTIRNLEYEFEDIPKNIDVSNLRKVEKVIGFKTVPVFADTQTNITLEDYPELLKKPFEAYTKNNYEELAKAIISYNSKKGIEVKLNENLEPLTGGFYNKFKKLISINQEVKYDAKIKTLFHETAHAVLHDNEAAYKLDRNGKEVQAETVAYVLTNYFLKISPDSSVFYAKKWGDEINKEERLNLMLDTIKSCKEIIEGVEKEINLERSNKEKDIKKIIELER